MIAATSAAHAQGAALDSSSAAPPPPPTAGPAPDAADKPEYGIDLRLREVYLPAGLIGLFVTRAAGGASNTGYGVDFVRRRGTLELQLGLEYEHITMQEGVYINSGDNVANGDTIDYILSPAHAGTDFGWFTLEFTFMNHAPINKYVSFRYGGGAGIGILTGAVKRYDTACAPGATNDNVTPQCVPAVLGTGGGGTISPDSSGEKEPAAYNLPPVFPVVNAIIGFQIKPTDKAVINIEGGIRTLPFIGVSAGYFF
ncbi:MAG TPA: hypothetical protein VMJ10_32975 [Kofleriaceae bacterium]|nr:hypothetical protein [Kofleriaceae bacterium]